MRKVFGPLLILAIVGSLAFVQRTVLVDIWNRLIELPRISLLPLLGAAIVMIIARGAFLAACSPGVTLRQAVMTDQSALAAGYGIVLGGGLVGTGMRIHMFTRWGIAHISIASSIIATAVVPSFSTWGLPVVLLSIPVIKGTATSPQALAVLVGVPIILFSLVFTCFLVDGIAICKTFFTRRKVLCLAESIFTPQNFATVYSYPSSCGTHAAACIFCRDASGAP